jgi:hypothetical protein
MASVKKMSGKVRTTQELVQEMALRSASPSLVSHRTPQSPDGSKEDAKAELLNRFLESRHSEGSLASSPEVPNPEAPSTVEDVLAKLPPIDEAAVLAELKTLEEEEEDDGLEVEGLIPVLARPQPETGPEVLQQLHEGQKESFNGNFNHEGEFHEWSEVVSKRTKDDNLLYILPYCLIE